MRVGEQVQEGAFCWQDGPEASANVLCAFYQANHYRNLTSQRVAEDDQASRVIEPLDPVSSSVVLKVDKYVLDIARLELLAEPSERENLCLVDGALAREDARHAQRRRGWDGALRDDVAVAVAVQALAAVEGHHRDGVVCVCVCVCRSEVGLAVGREGVPVPASKGKVSDGALKVKSWKRAEDERRGRERCTDSFLLLYLGTELVSLLSWSWRAMARQLRGPAGFPLLRPLADSAHQRTVREVRCGDMYV